MQIKEDLPNWRDLLRTGNLVPIMDWLKEKIHLVGNLKDPQDLMKEITGDALNSKEFINYLTQKMKRVYS